MDWELTKENCVPVRQGRSKAALQELAAQDPATEALEAKRRELWAEITDYKGDDPLEPWQRYIKWMQEYGVRGGKSDLLKVLEACTKELQKYPRYTNDIRFLRIWIQYADCLPDPDDVFLFLKEKGIGRDFALYYEAYATYFELKGNFQGADAVYMDGIQRGVKQLERLKQKHNAFQQRMAQRVQRRIQDEQVMGPPPPEPLRANLAAIGSRSAGRGHQQQQQSSANIFGIAAAPQQASGLFGLRPGPAQPPRGLQPAVGLYEDEEFARGENPRYSAMPQANSSRELQPYSVRRKENLDSALAWNQAVPLLPGAATIPAGPSAGGIDIFTDEEFQDSRGNPAERVAGAGHPQRSEASAAAGPSAGHALLLSGTDRSAGAGVDALMLSLAPPRTLLRGLAPGPTHSVSESIAAALAPHLHVPPHASLSAAAAAGGPLIRQVDGAASGRGGHASRPGLPAIADVPPASTTVDDASCEQTGEANDEELSYEELRAVAWLRCNPVPRLQTSSTAETAGVSRLGGATAGPSGAAPVATGPKRTALSGQPLAMHTGNPESLRSVGQVENGAGAGPACNTGRGANTSTGDHVRRAPFGQVVPAAAAGPSGSCTADQENGPAATGRGQPRRALADAAPAVRMPLGLPAGSLGLSFPAAQHGPTQPEPPPIVHSSVTDARDRDRTHDEAQATVTISTRGAFDLINSLFSEDLPHQQARADHEQSRPSSSRTELAAAVVPPPPLSETVRLSWPQPQATQPTALPTAAQPPVAEPTVTLHTKLAFDALNDMFCDTLPHEEARKLARRGAPSGGGGSSTGHMPISNADVRRLANAGRSSCVAAAPSTGRRDPPCSSGGNGGGGGVHNVAVKPNLPTAHGLAAAASSLAIHEDTFFLGPAPAALPGDSMRGSVGDGVRLVPAAVQAHDPAHRPDVGALYEDTEFIPRGGGLSGGGGGSASAAPSRAFILEDTEFMTRHHGPHLAAPAVGGYDRSTRAHAGSGSASFAAPAGRPGGRDLCGPKASDKGTANYFQQRHVPAKGSLQVYEDTQYDF